MSLPTTDASSHTTAADRLHGSPPCVAVTSGLVVQGGDLKLDTADGSAAPTTTAKEITIIIT